MSSQLIRSMLLVMFASIVGSFGGVFLKKGANRLTGKLTSFVSKDLAFGIGLYLGSSVFYGLGLKGGDVSVLYPMVSLGYVATLVWGKIFFGEEFTKTKIAGLALVLIGVCFVGMGSS